MPKVGMEAVRQRQFIEATIETIHLEGLQSTTLSKVARRAGASTGLVAHYFNDKAGLLEGTLRYLARSLQSEFRRYVSHAETPRERVLAVIEANFAHSQAAPAVVSAWLSFWSQVNHQPRIARIQRIVTNRLQSNLLFGLRQLVPARDATHIATGLGVLIDGLWLRATLQTGGVSIQEARTLARDYLTIQLASRETRRTHALSG